MKRQAGSPERVKIGFLIDGVELTLWMSLQEAKRMDAVLLGERVRFRLNC